MIVDLGVALTGDRAVEWLNSYRANATPLDGSLQLSADLMATTTISITRIWHSPVQIELRSAAETGNDHVYLSFMMRGTLDVAEETNQNPLDMPPIYVHDTAGNATIRTEHESSRIVFGIRRSKIEAILGHDITSGRPRFPDAGLRRVALAAAVASFTAEIDEESPAYVLWRSAIENLVIAALRSSQREAVHEASMVINRAKKLIAEHASDPDFSVTELGKQLMVSQSHLHRVFRSIGTTPAKAVRETRLNAARDLLTPSATLQEIQSASLQAGFRNLRMFYRAMQEVVEENTAPEA